MNLLNPRVAGRPASPTLAINERSRELQARGDDVIRLGFGQSPFPVPHEVVAELQSWASAKDYEPTRGLPELRSAVAGWHARRGVEARAEDVLIGPGSKELIFLVQFALECELLLPSPSWVSYSPQAEMLGLGVRWLETRPEDAWRLSPATLEAAADSAGARPQLLVLNHPSNPTGAALSSDDLAALAAVARRHGMLILSDEIYGELHHTGEHCSLARAYPEGTIVTGGLSKWCGAGGWRVGTALFPEAHADLRDAVASLASETYSAVAAPIQRAAVAAFNGSAKIDAYLDASRAIVAAVGREVWGLLRAAGVRVVEPEGGFYLFPDFTPMQPELTARGISGSAKLCARLLDETGVALLPGTAFGRPADELTARLAYVDFDGEAALHSALEAERPLTPEWVEAHAPRVVEGARRIVSWLSA